MSTSINLDNVGISRVYELVTHLSASGFELRDGARIVRCPSLAHPVKHAIRDEHPSCKLTPSKDAWHCYSCGAGGKTLALIIAAGKADEVERRTDKVGRPLSPEARALAWLEGALGLEPPTLQAQPLPERTKAKGIHLRDEQFAGEYTYRDAHGKPRYYLLRIEGYGEEGVRDKRFEFIRPVEPRAFEREWTIEQRPYVDASGRVAFTIKIIGGLTGPKRGIRCERVFPIGSVEHIARNYHDVEILPYHLDEVIAGAHAHRVILFVEGERDADVLRSLGFIATSTPFGASFKPPETWKRYFRGAAYLASIGDADAHGRRSARTKCDILAGAAAVTACCDLWPERNDGYDVSDFVADQRASGRGDDDIRAAIHALLRQPLLQAKRNTLEGVA